MTRQIKSLGVDPSSICLMADKTAPFLERRGGNFRLKKSQIIIMDIRHQLHTLLINLLIN